MGHNDRAATLREDRVFALDFPPDGAPADLDMLSLAAICLNHRAEIIWFNSAAAALLGEADGLRRSGAGLAAATVEATSELNRLIRHTALSRTAAALALDRPSGNLALAAIAVPCRQEPEVAWLFVSDPCPLSGEAQRAARLVALYRLTQAEAIIALRITAGCGLPAIAAALDLSPSTIRTHTKHIFAKLQVHNQVQLTRLIVYAGLFAA